MIAAHYQKKTFLDYRTQAARDQRDTVNENVSEL